jgi:MOSC domain-containing protein YiiM
VARVLSVNIGTARPSPHSESRRTGIDKRPVEGPVAVRAPGPKGLGGSGLAGDSVVDLRNHGGNDQAVYAYAREDLDVWQAELERPLRSGMFGENLTVEGLDVTGARVGERWQVGADVVLEVADPRIPCGTFAGWLGERGWERRFTQRGAPGAYLRVIAEGTVRAGDAITICHRPEHAVTIGLMFRALTTEPALLPELLAAGDALPEETRRHVEAYLARAARGPGSAPFAPPPPEG